MANPPVRSRLPNQKRLYRPYGSQSPQTASLGSSKMSGSSPPILLGNGPRNGPRNGLAAGRGYIAGCGDNTTEFHAGVTIINTNGGSNQHKPRGTGDPIKRKAVQAQKVPKASDFSWFDLNAAAPQPVKPHSASPLNKVRPGPERLLPPNASHLNFSRPSLTQGGVNVIFVNAELRIATRPRFGMGTFRLWRRPPPPLLAYGRMRLDGVQTYVSVPVPDLVTKRYELKAGKSLIQFMLTEATIKKLKDWKINNVASSQYQLIPEQVTFTQTKVNRDSPFHGDKTSMGDAFQKLHPHIRFPELKI